MTSPKRLIAALVLFVAAAGQANASVVAVPEIDAGAGFAAIAIFLCVGMMLRERFAREAPAKA